MPNHKTIRVGTITHLKLLTFFCLKYQIVSLILPEKITILEELVVGQQLAHQTNMTSICSKLEM